MSQHSPITVPASPTKRATSRRVPNRRRAKDLSDERIGDLKRDFAVRRNTLEVAQAYLLPRAEAVDGVLIQLCDNVRTVRNELDELRRVMGVADRSMNSRVYLMKRSA
jgi:hypothetical protein